MNSAAVFQGRIFAAFGNMLAFYDRGGTSGLLHPRQFGELRAQYVAASANNIYILHNPLLTSDGGSQYPAGIYVYNSQFQHVSYLQATPKVFGVSPDDRYLYSNEDDTQIKIYSISKTGP